MLRRRQPPGRGSEEAAQKPITHKINRGYDLIPDIFGGHRQAASRDILASVREPAYDTDLALARLSLVKAVQIVLRKGLALLGVSAPEKM